MGQPEAGPFAILHEKDQLVLPGWIIVKKWATRLAGLARLA